MKDFEIFRFQVIQLILTECPGRGAAAINELIDRNIEDFCADYFKGMSIENTAKNILFAEVVKLTTKVSN